LEKVQRSKGKGGGAQQFSQLKGDLLGPMPCYSTRTAGEKRKEEKDTPPILQKRVKKYGESMQTIARLLKKW